jgi:uncharacterized LabA/DUF88 family protein/cold shock CspA family protein
MSKSKAGVYVDLSNITMNGGYGMRFDVLREFILLTSDPVRLNVYLAFDEERAKNDPEYDSSSKNYHGLLRDWGYKVIEKKVKWFKDESGNRVRKSNVDLDLTVDALTHAQYLDRIILVTGDGDFAQVIRALQDRGCKVEVLAFDNVSDDLRKAADLFISGYLIPDLLPTNDNRDNTHAEWGDINTRVRGTCYTWHHEKGFGFVRYLRELSDELWRTDTRSNNSPYMTAFAHMSHMQRARVNVDLLPSREIVFEFTIVKGEKGIMCDDIKQITS